MQEIINCIKKEKIKGIGVEIGVWKGRSSNFFLSNTNLKKFFSIDPWDLNKSNYRSKWSQKDLDESYQEAKLNLSQFGDRSEIIKDTSKNASKLFGKNTLDFIYIDAMHDYQSVVNDINFWWEKLKPRGVFSGHDYIEKTIDDLNYGVIEAVNEHVSKFNLKLFLTDEKFKSWYLIKPIKQYV